MAGLEFLGVDFERIHVDFFAGEHKEPAFTQLNPNASLPVLTDGDFVLWESNAIPNLPPTSMNAPKPTPKTLGQGLTFTAGCSGRQPVGSRVVMFIWLKIVPSRSWMPNRMGDTCRSGRALSSARDDVR